MTIDGDGQFNADHIPQLIAPIMSGAYSRESLLRLTIYHSFTYTHETFLDLAAKRVPIAEVPLVVRGVRESGQSKIASNVLRYAWQTAAIILRTYRDQKPMALCFALAIPSFIVGLALLGWSYAHLLQTGSFLKSIALAGGGVIAVGVATLHGNSPQPGGDSLLAAATG